MCGRFTLRAAQNLIFDEFHVKADPRSLFGPRYNIAPTQQVAGVRLGDDGRELALLRWGLIPSWAQDEKIGSRMINARAETVAEKRWTLAELLRNASEV